MIVLVKHAVEAGVIEVDIKLKVRALGLPPEGYISTNINNKRLQQRVPARPIINGSFQWLTHTTCPSGSQLIDTSSLGATGYLYSNHLIAPKQITKNKSIAPAKTNIFY